MVSDEIKETIAHNVASLTDGDFETERVFARAVADDDDPADVAWRAALEREAEKRGSA